jgi:hypothetical protein
VLGRPTTHHTQWHGMDQCALGRLLPHQPARSHLSSKVALSGQSRVMKSALQGQLVHAPLGLSTSSCSMLPPGASCAH